jgi:GntR family transcriptional repressor for pyruvate dehydrogenase complex
VTGSTVRPPAYQVLADELRADITSGRLQPGERLPPEPALCVKTGVSRSTVREALRLLASQHLIVTTRGVTGGSFVSHPDAEQLADGLAAGFTLLSNSADVGLADMLELRRALEIPAAELAAARRTEEHLIEIRRALFDPETDDFDTRRSARTSPACSRRITGRTSTPTTGSCSTASPIPIRRRRPGRPSGISTTSRRAPRTEK